MLLRTTDDPDELAAQNGDIARFLFGVPFLSVGILAISAGCFRLATAPPDLKAVVGGFVIGALFACVGAVLVFDQSGFVINRRTRTLRTWDRFIWWRGERHYSLNEFQSVTLTRRWNMERGPRWWCRIHLVPLDPKAASVPLSEHLSEALARDRLRQLSAFLDLPATIPPTDE